MKFIKKKESISIIFVIFLFTILFIEYISFMDNIQKNVARKFLKTLYTSDATRYEYLLNSQKFDKLKPVKIELEDLSIYTEIYKDYTTKNCMNRMKETYGNMFLLTDKFAYETNSKVVVDNIKLRLDQETKYDYIYTYKLYFTNKKDNKEKQHSTIGEIYVSKLKPKVSHINLYDQLCFEYIKEHLN